jgi:hypothetical protein
MSAQSSGNGARDAPRGAASTVQQRIVWVERAGDGPDSQRRGSQPAQSINFLIDHGVASLVFLSAFPQQGTFNPNEG